MLQELEVLCCVLGSDLDVVDPVVLLNVLALNKQLSSLGSLGSLAHVVVQNGTGHLAVNNVLDSLFQCVNTDQVTHITLPLIKGVFGTSVVLWTTKTMGFFALSQVFSAASTVTPMFYTYQTLFGAADIGADSVNAGVAAGAAVVMTVVVMIISLVSRRLIKDEGYEL